MHYLSEIMYPLLALNSAQNYNIKHYNEEFNYFMLKCYSTKYIYARNTFGTLTMLKVFAVCYVENHHILWKIRNRERLM